VRTLPGASMDKVESVARIVVSDAGPLIHLDEVGCLNLLADFAQVLVPDAVWLEVARHRPSALQCPGIPLSQTSHGEVISAELEELARLFALHPGEVQALHIAAQRRVEFLLTDDAAARLAARHVGIPVHGTLGILLRAIRRGQRTASEVGIVLRSLPSASSLHLKRSLLDEIVQIVDQVR